MSAIIYYMTHSGRAAESKFLLPHWERFGIPIVVVTPHNSEIPHTKHGHIAWGEPGPMGDPMYLRILNILGSFVHSTAEFALLVEFDCMCLLDNITFRNGLHGTPQLRHYEHAVEFMAERYVTPPYMLDRNSALKMLAVAAEYPEVKEGGYADRLMAALANLAGVPVLGFPEGSWSKLMPKVEELGLDMKRELSTAVDMGVKWFHFIKTKAQFDYINSLVKK